MKTEAACQELAVHPDNEHFEFGRNWTQFLSSVNEDRVVAAENSLKRLLKVESLSGRTFLDAGSGSGLFSLAATRLGAVVTSFDLDAQSIACTKELFRRYSISGDIRSGSLTDAEFLTSLGRFDIVYCWGVAHHTGRMWESVAHLLPAVDVNGQIVLAIYNDQQYISRAWSGIKSIYQRLPVWLRPLLVAAIGIGTFLKRLVVTMLAMLLRLVTHRNPLTPLKNWLSENRERGMHKWYDLVDWVGGWPFEVAKPEDIFRFVRDRGFTLQEMTTSAGHGCNEFVFIRTNDPVETV